MEPDEIAARLSTFLERQTGARPVRVRGLRRLPGGASRETWAFDAVFGADDGPTRALILRRDPGPTSVDSDRALEFRVLHAAQAGGVPVPAPLWLGEDPAILGARFFVMERVDGETLARRLLRDEAYAQARAVMAAQLGRILARIHTIPLGSADLDGLPGPAEGSSGAEAELHRYEQLYRLVAPEPHPVIELGLRWLVPRVPTRARLALVHGDYRVGNVMFDATGVRAILDWELAHRGDPMEDLGWICVKAWRFGSALPVGGLGSREELFAAYEQAGGEPVDRDAVRYWETFGTLKWAIICIAQARTYLDGSVPSLELASLGRRTAEVEHDLLELVG